MRDKLESSEPHSFKTGRGGIYDIDFLLGYLMIRHGVTGKNGGFRDRMWRLVSAGVLEKSVAATLDHSAELLRTVDHLTRLVTGRVLKALPASEHALKVVESLTAKCFGSAFPPGLAERCKQTMLTIRKIYDHELKAS
jgi:glutamine synthetase adenylyltransferase